MHCTLLRNATLRLEYAGRTILIDPYLAEAGALEPLGGGARNPTVPLPVSPAEAVAGIDAFLVSHEHPDHWDEAAAAAIPKDTPAFCQPGVEGRLAVDGFTDVTVIDDHHEWEGIRLTRTGGHHGRGEIEAAMGPVSGFVFSAEGEPTVYWAGDTIWCEEVEQAIAAHAPTWSSPTRAAPRCPATTPSSWTSTTRCGCSSRPPGPPSWPSTSSPSTTVR